MKNLHQEERDILFLDIETVPACEKFQNLDEKFQQEWKKKASYFKSQEEDLENFHYDRAGIYAEFGKIVVIGLGFFSLKEKKIHTKSLVSQSGDEQKLLSEFKKQLETLEQYTKNHNRLPFFLCGHNSIEFDFPYICRRFLTNDISLPASFSIQGAKSWNLERHLDTMQMWKFGDYKHYTSLNLLAALFNLPTSKDGIDGSQVYETYYSEAEDRFEKLSEYCKKDVILTAKVYRKLLCQTVFSEDDIEYKEDIYL